MKLRFATEQDASACLAIYAQYIDTSITFETVLPPMSEFSARIRTYGAVYPWLIAEENGQVLAYAYAHRAQERAAYDWNAELSVYVAKAAAGKSLGTRLYGALLELLQRQGVRNAYGVVTMPNAASAALHEKFGFRLLGTYRKSGYKAGAWRDVVWYEKQIGTFDGVPEALLPIGRIDARLEILRRYAEYPMG